MHFRKDLDRREYPFFRCLTIVGDGLMRAELSLMTKDLKIDDNVLFAGPVVSGQVATFLNGAKFSVMPSKIATDGDQEGLGLVAGESLACGCITIVSDLPAIQDVHSEPLLQFEAANVESLYERMLFVYRNQEQSLALSSGLRVHVLKSFSWESVGASYASILDAL